MKIAKQSKTEPWILQHVNHCGDECLIWPFGRDSGGYARATARNHSTRLAHRIMCEMAHGPAPFDGAVARHTCGNGHLGCVNPTHLSWATVAENNRDKEKHGTKPIGERIGRAVLTRQDVRTIREMLRSGKSQRKVADSFCVSSGTIQAIYENRTWRHVK